MVLTFESVDEILSCVHSNETTSQHYFHMVLLTFKFLYKMKFEICLEC